MYIAWQETNIAEYRDNDDDIEDNDDGGGGGGTSSSSSSGNGVMMISTLEILFSPYSKNLIYDV